MTATLQVPRHAGEPTPGGVRTPGEPRPRNRRTIRLYVVDLAILAAFVLLMDVALTGLAVHEWLGLAVGIGLTAHLVQHAGWIAVTGRRLLSTSSIRNRVNYLMLVVLFAAFLTAIWSGIMISEAALPFLGIQPAENPFWTWLHLVSVQLVLWLTALHVALNWKWIVSTTRRVVGMPLRRAIGDRA